MKIVKRLLLLAVLFALAAGAGAWVVYQRVQQPFRGFDGPEQFVEIAPGTGASTIGARLAEAGVVRDARTFRVALWLSGRGRELKAGEYRFDREATPFEVIDRIARGDAYKRLITFREGLTIPEMAQVFEERGFGAAAEFEQAAKNASLIGDLDSEAADLEGYLFPETYALPRGTSAAELVTQMVGLFKRLYAEPLRAEAAAAGFSTRQIVTLASLVEKETARGEERPLVAAVYRNRLKIGMGMPMAPAASATTSRALSLRDTRTGSLVSGSRDSTANASACRPSPARIAIPSPNTTCDVGRPRRSESSSIAGRSSWISEEV